MFKKITFLLLFLSTLLSFGNFKKVDSIAFVLNDEPITVVEAKAYFILFNGNCNFENKNYSDFKKVIEFEKVYFIINKYSKFKFSDKKFKIARYKLDDYYNLDISKLKGCGIDDFVLNKILKHYLTVNSFFKTLYPSGFTKENLNDFLKSSTSVKVSILDKNFLEE